MGNPTFFESPIEFLKGVGPQRAALLQKELNIFTFGDLLGHYPFRYEDRTRFYTVAETNETMPFVQLDAGDAQRTRQGIAIPLKGREEISNDGQKVRMRDSEGNLIAIGSYDAAEQLLRPRVVLSISS